jgi:hypothetical protein
VVLLVAAVVVGARRLTRRTGRPPATVPEARR